MTRKKWILTLTVFMAVAQQQIHAACACNEKGKDGCATCTRIIRPKPKHTERPKFQLPPVGDNCWCRKTLTEPSSLPKPCPQLKDSLSNCKSPRSTVSPAAPALPVSYVPALVKDNSPPADPISISLALQAGKAIQVPEAKLAYGFVRRPINRLPKVSISSIKEENLYALANDVITWKKPVATRKKTLEEDYREPREEGEEEEELESAGEDYDLPSLTYKQLGYEAEEFQNPEFIPISSFAETDGATALLHDKLRMQQDLRAEYIEKMNNIRKLSPINRLIKR